MSETQDAIRQTQAGTLLERIGAATRETVVTSVDSPALLQSDVLLAGFSSAAPDFAFRRPAPRADAFLVGIEGGGMVALEGRWKPLEPGSVYHMPRGHPHAYRAGAEGGWTIAWAHFAAPAVRGPVRMEPAPVDPSAYHAAIRHLRRELRGAADPAAVHHWSALLGIHAHRLVGHRPTMPDDRLAGLWEAVEADLARDWRVRDLAALAGLSEERVRQLTRRDHGTSPMRHVATIRMQRAAYLLQTTRWTLDAVSEAVGYASPFAFSAAFKRVTGRSPEAFRATRARD